MISPIKCIINNSDVEITGNSGRLVLDYLRHEMRLCGTKEGCKEGDCGACTVLIGELDDGSVSYRAVTSCLIPVGELAGKHLVTIEGLNLPTPTPIQHAIVDEGGTQCGFCTPGIVVSLMGQIVNDGKDVSEESLLTALSGHLCRCTGYASLFRACTTIQNVAQTLPQDDVNVAELVKLKLLPEWFDGIPQRLQQLGRQQEIRSNGEIAPRNTPQIVAGGTDIYVQRGYELAKVNVHALNLQHTLNYIQETNEQIVLGPLVTFEAFAQSRLIQAQIPKISEYMALNASLQIRNRATLGGNIVNASPIGDMTIFLLALDSGLVLSDGDSHREVEMKSFFQDYKKIDMHTDEILTEISFKKLAANEFVHFEKVSKRRNLDIASVNSAIRISIENRTILKVGLAVGGVAAVPLWMENTVQFLEGQKVSPSILNEALAVADAEIQPISDIRGSAEYKRLLTRNLLIAHFLELFPDQVDLSQVVNV